MTAPSPRRSPYQGLVPYHEEDAPFFFGRDRDVRLIVANLFAAPLTLLYGPSGSGKSSVLQAGVIYQLRARDDLLIVPFSAWQHEPLVGFEAAVAREVARVVGAATPSVEGVSLVAYLDACAARLGRRLMIILDQFEEYFLYHAEGEPFGVELPHAILQSDAPTSFLVSLREDALAKLDRFEGRIPNLFDNYLRIEHLDRDAARAAIVKPLEQYSRLVVTDGQDIGIEAPAVESVLYQVRTGQVVLGGGGSALTRVEVAEARIQAPYLQLVMTRLWDEEMRAGSRLLRLETLDRLGGAQRIVRTHLDTTMNGLQRAERDHAARLLRYLVTPSGTKIALSAGDLADFADLARDEVVPVLEKLAGRDARILSKITAGLPEWDEPRYEIFHDVLAGAVLDWRARHERARERARAEAVGRRGIWAPILLTIAGWLLVAAITLVAGALLVHASGRDWIFITVGVVILAGLALTIGRNAVRSCGITAGTLPRSELTMLITAAWILGLLLGQIMGWIFSFLIYGLLFQVFFGSSDAGVTVALQQIVAFVVQCIIVGLVINRYARRSERPIDL